MADQTKELTLGEKQRLFMRLLPRLLDFIHTSGFECTVGDAYRDPRAFGAVGEKGVYGAMYSCHKSRLAIDLNLFRDPDGDGPQPAAYMPDTEMHRPIGEWWEKQHPLCCWGGRFEDGNHYSLTHEGRK